jgi:type II secretory pathway predicted ATPase ExeA
MKNHYRVFFGFQREPFPQELPVTDMLKTKPLMGVRERFRYAVALGAVCVITGDIGSGKSSALRFAAHELHPAEYRIVSVTATSGTIIELYRQICYALDIETSSFSKAFLTRTIRAVVRELIDKKLRPVLIIDEASLLRLDVFAELHTILHNPPLPLVLAGQNNLLDNLMFRQSRALASRVVAKGCLTALENEQDMTLYLKHHLSLAGSDYNLFDDSAVTAVLQGSGGLLRRANHLARGALIAAAQQQHKSVVPEHVQIAQSELI